MQSPLICVPCLNHCVFTKLCLDSILATVPPTAAEILVVDDGSTDDTNRLLASYGGRIRVYRNSIPLGAFASVNVGLRLAGKRPSVIVANDHVLVQGWLKALTKAAGTRVGVYSPMVPDMPISPLTVEIAGRRNPLREHFFKGREETDQDIQEFLRRLYPEGLTSFSQKVTKEAQSLGILPGCWAGCQIIPSEVVEVIGYFDERFGHHGWADIDFMGRAQAADFPIGMVPFYVHHFGSITLRKAMGDLDQQSYAGRLTSAGESFFHQKQGLLRERVSEYEMEGRLCRIDLKSTIS